MVQLVHADPDVYLIKVPYLTSIPSSYTNCYAIVDSGDVLMVDTGAPTEEAYDVVVEALRDKFGLQPSNVRYFLTHLHLDHSGLIERLADRNTVVYTSKAEHEYVLSLLDENARRAFEAEALAEGIPESHLPDLMKVLMDQTGPATFGNADFQIEYVSEGSEIAIGRYSFEVVSTPGHSSGHVSLFNRDSSLLLDGDHILFHMNPSIVHLPGDGDSLGAYYRSLDVIEQLGVSKVLVSHDQHEGPVVKRIREIRSHHKDRSKKVVNALRRAPDSSAFELTTRLEWSGIGEGGWQNASPVLRWCTFAQTLATLKHLFAEGFVERRIDEAGKPRYRALR